MTENIKLGYNSKGFVGLEKPTPELLRIGEAIKPS